MILQKKEHLLHYMLKGHVHLSKKDYGFFNNLTYIIKEKNQVTSNQNKLFDKLIVKYQRQLRNLGHSIENLQKLNWSVQQIESSEAYLVPKIYLESDMLCMRTPFNAKFVQALKVVDDNTFVWNKDDKLYRSKFFTHSLRIAYDFCLKYFDKVELSQEIKNMLHEVQAFDDIDMAPILSVTEGKYYISNMNKSLQDSIKDIELNDNPKTLFQLSRYGVKIHPDITKNDPRKLFASNFINQIDIDDLLGPAIEFIKELGIDSVYFVMRRLGTNNDKIILNTLSSNNIKIIKSDFDIPDGVLVIRWSLGIENSKDLNVTHIKSFDCRKISKIINVVNSRPVTIK